MLRRNNESGQALVFGVATLGILLIGIAGLGIDMGYLRYQKRLLQAAADSAAIAAASDLPTAFGGVTLAAQNAAAANGYTVASVNLATCPPPAPATAIGSISLTVNNGPCSGPHTGLSTYVEVYLSQVQPTFFMRALGTTSETITARAVATSLSGSTTGGGCLYTLGPPSSGIGVAVQGSADIDAPTCGIVDNGNFLPTGGAFTVNSGSFSVVDPGCIGSGCGKGTVTCGPTQSASNCPAYSSPPGPDPEAGLVAPTQPAASASCPGPVKGKAVACDVTTSGTTTLQPGTYSSIDFGKNSVTTLASGIYYINGGGLTFEGKGTVNDVGNGVMFYLTCPTSTPCSNGATLNAVGGGNVPDIQLTAPSPTNCPACPSQYDGILFYQDKNDTNPPSLGGDDNTTLNGVLYFPSVTLTFFGHNSFTAGIVIADSIGAQGNPTVTLSGAAGLPTGVSFVANAVLVE